MTPEEALLFAARVLQQTGESGTTQAVLLLEQLAEDYGITADLAGNNGSCANPCNRPKDTAGTTSPRTDSPYRR